MPVSNQNQFIAPRDMSGDQETFAVPEHVESTPLATSDTPIQIHTSHTPLVAGLSNVVYRPCETPLPAEIPPGSQKETFFTNDWRILHQRSNVVVYALAHPKLWRPNLSKAQNTFIHTIHSGFTQGTTRLMPKISPLLSPATLCRTHQEKVFEALLLFVFLVLVAIVQSYHLFDYPRYEMDEGTYMASAWSILHGQITPYPYGYGHPPLAWLQIGLLSQLLGGFFTFGNAINTGRVIMLAYTLVSTALVYLLVRRLGGSRGAALLALTLFAFSPLSIAYHRQVFLDNVSTFWLLLALYLLVRRGSGLPGILFAALALGCAILSKEVFLLFLPALLYAVWLVTTPFQRKFALVCFVYVTLSICSTFLLLAALKGELFPYSWHLPGDIRPHLSLLQTYFEQGKRGSDEGSLIDSFLYWSRTDPVLTYGCIIPVLFNLVVSFTHRKHRAHRLMALLALSFWFLFIRGGVVLSFYAIPLIPLAAINSALALDTITRGLGQILRQPFIRGIALFVLTIALLNSSLGHIQSLSTQRPTTAQVQAMNWIRTSVPSDAFIVINSYLYLDLHVAGGMGVRGNAVYPLAHVYFNVVSDPEIRQSVLQNDWRNIDYLVVDSDMLADIAFHPHMDLLKQALSHATLSAEFNTSSFKVSIYKVHP